MKIMIIGATSAIGENLSRELSEKGHNIYGVGRKEDILKGLEDKGYLKGYTVADLVTKEGRKDVVEYSQKNEVNCLIYSLGLIDSDRLEETPEDRIKMIIDTNLTSIMQTDREFLTKGFLPKRIVYLASISSLYSWEAGAAYQASKTGLMAYISAMRIQNDTERIAIYPDTIATGRGMSSKLEDFPKIPLDTFVKEFGNIVEGNYDGKEFEFIINDDESISMKELLLSEQTLRPVSYDSKELKNLGKAVK